MPEELTFRKARKEEISRISEFRKTFFEYNPLMRSYEPEYYEWKCYQNPILPGEMWLAEDDGKVVAIKNVTPKRMKVLGDVITVAEMGDSFTHPDYQRRGIFTRLSKAARESIVDKGVSLIYNTPDKDTALSSYIKRLNHMPVPIEVRPLVKPLSSKQLLTTKLRSSRLASVFSPMIDIVSQALFRISMTGTAKSGVLVCLEPTFPDDIDSLWEQASKSNDVMLMRTKSYLEWRYVTNPDTYSILIARSRDGAILGYMATKIGVSENIATGFVCDFLTIDDDPNIFKKLLAIAVEEFNRKKVNVIYTWAVKGSHFDKILLKLGFLPRSKIFLLCYENELGSRVLSKAYKWHFTMGDTDNI